MRPVAGNPAFVAVASLLTVSAWWFMQMFVLAGSQATAANYLSVQAIQALVLLQFLCVGLFAPQAGSVPVATAPWRTALLDNALHVVALVLPAWPLLAILMLASGRGAGPLVVAEIVVVIAGLGVAVLSQMLGQLRLDAETTRVARLLPGLVTGAIAWVFRQDLLQWIGL